MSRWSLKPGDLRFWDEGLGLPTTSFVLIKRVAPSPRRPKDWGWRILEGDVVKGVWETIILNYSHPAEELSK